MKNPLARIVRAVSPADRRAAANQPFSPNTVAKAPRIRDAVAVPSVCPYCAVGCGQLVYVKGGKVIDVEGNPESPISEGSLCPKGANTFQLHHNPHRQKYVLWRAPYAKDWVRKPLGWAMDRIATLVKESRDNGYEERNEEGKYVNHCKTIGSLGGATLDNEENYLIKKLFSSGLGIVSIENQARI